MTLNELCKLSHDRAVEAGWWEPGKEKSALECHMLIVSEVAEATEEVRNGQPPFYLLDKSIPPNQGQVRRVLVDQVSGNDIAQAVATLPTGKPEGEAVELADAVIRIADWFGRHDWDLEAVIKAKMEFNRTRGYRHGGKAA